MANEAKRGCGYRKVGALYLCGNYINVPCDRLPLELKNCPVCGAGIHFTRSMTEVNPFRLFGNHENCKDAQRPCHVCDPPDAPAYIMTVGKKYYTPQSFLQEASAMGVSKRIAHIPKSLKLGETVVYLAHPEAVIIHIPPWVNSQDGVVENPRLLDAEQDENRLGIFCAFIPQRIEMPIWKSELIEEKKAELEKRVITSVPIPDGDTDHANL